MIVWLIRIVTYCPVPLADVEHIARPSVRPLTVRKLSPGVQLMSFEVFTAL
jgi:hypothetical protein